MTNLTTKPRVVAWPGSHQPPPLGSERAAVERHKMPPLCVQAGVKRYEFAEASQLSHIRALHSLALFY